MWDQNYNYDDYKFGHTYKSWDFAIWIESQILQGCKNFIEPAASTSLNGLTCKFLLFNRRKHC
jgi:hypothetical protein